MDAARRGPTIIKGSPPQNMELIRAVHYSYSRAQMLLLVLVHYSVAAIGHDSYAGFNTHYDAGWK